MGEKRLYRQRWDDDTELDCSPTLFQRLIAFRGDTASVVQRPIDGPTSGPAFGVLPDETVQRRSTGGN
jgi:hypothetical protein